MSQLTKKSQRIQNIVFGVILILLFILVSRLFAPFVSVLLWSVLFYILFKPLHEKCTARFNRSTFRGKFCINAVSAVFSIGMVFLILVPLFFIVFQIFRQVIESLRQLSDYLSSHSFMEISIFDDVSRLIRDISSEQIVIEADELRTRIQSLLGSQVQSLLRMSGQAAVNVGGFFISLLFMIFSLYFLFVDGSYLSRLVLRVIPIRKEYLKTVVSKFKDIVRQLLLGYIIVALAEAVTAFIIFSIFRVSGALVFSTLVFFFSFIPLIGPSIIWIPLGLIRIFNGNILSGIMLMIICGIFISATDTFLRPFILKDRIQLHPLVIFFAILGGVSAFGINGMILGPMAVIIFLTVFDLFLTEHKLEQD